MRDSIFLITKGVSSIAQQVVELNGKVVLFRDRENVASFFKKEYGEPESVFRAGYDAGFINIVPVTSEEEIEHYETIGIYYD